MSSEFTSYLRNSSPISRLQNTNKIPLQDLRNSVDLKMSIFKHHPKNYLSSRTQSNCNLNAHINSNPNPNTTINTTTNNLRQNRQNSVHVASTLEEFSEMKASSVIYNIPEISPPQINFQISQQLRQKISQIKEDFVTKLPTIKSSQFSAKKVESVLSRRTVLKDLQTWLQEKLKTPPLTYEDSIQYKNMIMGVGMKEVIRLIGTRCVEQANFVDQIWELTWSICREIILHLSKRAHKCEKILQEEASFFRINCQTKIKRCDQLIKQLTASNTELKERSDKMATDLASMKKKNKQLKLTKMNLQSNFQDLKQQFELVFKQNLILHLKMTPNDQDRREWAKKKYKLYLNSSRKNDLMFKEFLEKILLENHMLFDQQELTQMDLRVDINKFKEERNKRMFQIQKQLHESFKTSEREAQTIIVQMVDELTGTEVKTYQQQSMLTQKITLKEAETNTLTLPDPKIKNKKDKIQKKGGDKKKIDQKSKTKTKLQSQELAQKQADEYSEQEGLQFKNNQSNLEEKIKQEQKEIEKQERKTEDPKIMPENQPITQIINIEQSIENVEERRRKLSRAYSRERTSEQIRNSESRQRHGSKLGQMAHQQYIQQIDAKKDLQIQTKLQQMAQLRRQLNKKEEEYNIEMVKLRQIISEKNSTIVNLNKSLANLSKKIAQAQDQKKVQIPEVPEIMEIQQVEQLTKEYREMEKLLKDRKYPDLLHAIQKKIYDYQSQAQGQKGPNKPIYSNRQVFQPIRKQKRSRKDHLFTYNKKNSPLSSKNDLEVDNYDLDDEDPVEQVTKNQIMDGLRQQSSQYASGKSSKRSSYSNNFKKYKNSRNQRDESFKYSLGNLKFVEICTKYIYDNIQVDNAGMNLIGKQAINNDYSKRFLRDQYRQIYKQVNQTQHPQKTQKQMRAVIQRSLNPLLKQLCKQIQNAQKNSLQKIQQVKISYIPLHMLITNKFNLNFGVKKVASKHIRDLLICLKGVRKYTDRYSIIAYFLLQSSSLKSNNSLAEAQDSQLLFFYLLLLTVLDGISSQRPVTVQQCFIISQLSKKYLTRDPKLTTFIKTAHENTETQTNNNNFVNLYLKIIKKYQQISMQRSSEMQFIYLGLCKKTNLVKSGIAWVDFVRFVSVFGVGLCQGQEDGVLGNSNWQSVVINTMIQTLLEQKLNQKGIISNECFSKFVVKCPQFSLQLMQKNLESLPTPFFNLNPNPTLHADLHPDLANPNFRQHLSKCCQTNPFLSQILQYLFSDVQISQNQIRFWIAFIGMYIVDMNVDQILDGVMIGVFDTRCHPVVLDRSRIGPN